MKLMKEAREATVKKAQRLEEILGRSIHIPKGGKKRKAKQGVAANESQWKPCNETRVTRLIRPQRDRLLLKGQ